MNPKTLKKNVLRVPEKESRGKRGRGIYLEKYWRAEKYLFSHGNKRESLGPSERAQEKFLEDTVMQLYEASSKHRGRTSVERWSATETDTAVSAEIREHGGYERLKEIKRGWSGKRCMGWDEARDQRPLGELAAQNRVGCVRVCLFPVGTQLALPECCKQGWRWSKICVIVKITSPAR